MDEEIEEWIPARWFNGYYECSTFGNIRSCTARRNCKHGNGRTVKGKLLKPNLAGKIYKSLQVKLTTKGSIAKNLKVHFIIFFSFNLEVNPIDGFEVDHVDNNRMNNKPLNLQYITERENSLKRTANYLNRQGRLFGCQYNNGSFMSRIYFNRKYYYLGTYKEEESAHNAYLRALNHINNGLLPTGQSQISTLT